MFGEVRDERSVQSDDFNRSRIRTVIAVVLTTKLRLADAPGNVPVSKEDAALPRDSVANVSQIITLDKSFLEERLSRVSDRIMMSGEDGIRTVLAQHWPSRMGRSPDAGSTGWRYKR